MHTLMYINPHVTVSGRTSNGSSRTWLRWSCPVWRIVETGTAASKRPCQPKSNRGRPTAACRGTAHQSTSTWLSLTTPVPSCDYRGAFRTISACIEVCHSLHLSESALLSFCGQFYSFRAWSDSWAAVEQAGMLKMTEGLSSLFPLRGFPPSTPISLPH